MVASLSAQAKQRPKYQGRGKPTTSELPHSHESPPLQGATKEPSDQEDPGEPSSGEERADESSVSFEDTSPQTPDRISPLSQGPSEVDQIDQEEVNDQSPVLHRPDDEARYPHNTGHRRHGGDRHRAKSSHQRPSRGLQEEAKRFSDFMECITGGCAYTKKKHCPKESPSRTDDTDSGPEEYVAPRPTIPNFV
ncbi:Hypothetical protein SMAX5B_016929 [Scophthalmus maximus]|uniref:Uncharacterized protein n=1 Tax=Scophthalmus maximus TaxID=52904 RepID=A0A2U9CJV4_SCOMX|nr:Hypothetical protein SMAX5B_016929 [Scophthalmus maximus]